MLLLGGMLGPSFRSKCKSLLRATITRAELVRNKRRATEKILRKDLADLLATRLELDAYKRAEGLLAELTVSSGYDFIEDSCHWLLRDISAIGRRKECPDKCKEAVASLMFAAAWFSDLPELRDLRDMFQSRYGKRMEFYVNQKFAESLKSKHYYSMEKKVRLMEHVAAEHSVKWNSGNFKLRIGRGLVPADHQVTRYEFLDALDGRKRPRKPSNGSSKGHHKPSEGKEKAILSRATWNYSTLHHDKKVCVKYKPGAKNEKRIKKQTHYLVGHGRGRGGVRPSEGEFQQINVHALDDKLLQIKPKRPVQQFQCGIYKDQFLPDTRRVGVPLQQQRGGASPDELNHNKRLDDRIIVKRKLGEPKRAGRTLQISILEVSEEERIIDKLLIRYSRNTHSAEKSRIESEGQPSNQTSSKAGQWNDKLALIPSTTRSMSLPKEQTAPPPEKERALIKISSCQPNRLAPHVHPKLPDYDDLAAKFAALKQQQQIRPDGLAG